MVRNVILGLIAALLAILLFLYSSPSDYESGKEQAFASSVWKEGDAAVRASMANHIIETDTLIGLSTAETRKLLGEPDVTHPRAHIYKLDFGHGWWPFTDWLYDFTIHIDSTGKAIQAGYSD